LDSVNTDKILAKNVTLAKIEDANAEANIIIADASKRPQYVAVSGDVTIGATGVTAIGSGVIVNNDIKSDAAIVYSKLLLSNSIVEADLAISNVPTDGYYLRYTTASGLTWSDVAGGFVEITDIIANEVPTGLINGSNTDFDLANTPKSGTLQVYLNGLLQEPGSGNDYILSTDSVTFSVAPETGDIVLCNYVK